MHFTRRLNHPRYTTTLIPIVLINLLFAIVFHSCIKTTDTKVQETLKSFYRLIISPRLAKSSWSAITPSHQSQPSVWPLFQSKFRSVWHQLIWFKLNDTPGFQALCSTMLHPRSTHPIYKTSSINKLCKGTPQFAKNTWPPPNDQRPTQKASESWT
jgi:hypothetical protein